MRRVSLREQKRKALDNILRGIVLARADNRCEKCRAFGGAFKANKDGEVVLQVAHFKSRRIEATRWDLDNVACLCKGCHFLWAHSQPDQFRDWWLERIGQKGLDRLNLIWKTPRRPDLEAIHAYLLSKSPRQLP